jgi:hypothetical protein
MTRVYVKPYVKRQKNDAADAEAICEAVTRATNAVRGDQDARAAERPDAPSHAPSVRPPADCGDQCDPWPILQSSGLDAKRHKGGQEARRFFDRQEGWGFP